MTADVRRRSFFLTQKWDMDFVTLGGDTNKTLLYTMGLSETDDCAMRLSSVTLSGENMSDLELQKYFEFDEADLIANRVGKLSKKQQEKIEADKVSFSRSTVKFSIFVVLIGIAISSAIIFFGMPGELSLDGLRYRYTQNADDVLTAVFVPAIFAVLFVGGAVFLNTMKIDHSVQKAEGKVKFVKVEKRETDTATDGTITFRDVEEYELRVGREAFEDVDEEMINILEEGDIYAFYYTKDAEQILSCEFISKGK